MNENTYKNGAISSNDIDVNTDCNDIIIITEIFGKQP